MTAKEKAKELVSKFNFEHLGDTYIIHQNIEESKRCALVAVDEIINTLNYDISDLDVRGNILLDLIEFCKEVKQEIQKL